MRCTCLIIWALTRTFDTLVINFCVFLKAFSVSEVVEFFLNALLNFLFYLKIKLYPSNRTIKKKKFNNLILAIVMASSQMNSYIFLEIWWLKYESIIKWKEGGIFFTSKLKACILFWNKYFFLINILLLLVVFRRSCLLTLAFWTFYHKYGNLYIKQAQRRIMWSCDQFSLEFILKCLMT